MKVYLVHKGEYDGRRVVGVFSSLEKAMAAYPKGGWPHHNGDSWWGNGLNFDDAASVEAYELDPRTDPEET
jgi:hypothetical protein